MSEGMKIAKSRRRAPVEDVPPLEPDEKPRFVPNELRIRWIREGWWELAEGHEMNESTLDAILQEREDRQSPPRAFMFWGS